MKRKKWLAKVLAASMAMSLCTSELPAFGQVETTENVRKATDSNASYTEGSTPKRATASNARLLSAKKASEWDTMSGLTLDIVSPYNQRKKLRIWNRQ